MDEITKNILDFQHASLDMEYGAAAIELEDFIIENPEKAAWCLAAMEEDNSQLRDILQRIATAAEQHPGGVDGVFSLMPEIREILQRKNKED